MGLTEREKFERSFARPHNFFKLNGEEQWNIDKRLGILDWRGEDLTPKDHERYKAHYKGEKDFVKDTSTP